MKKLLFLILLFSTNSMLGFAEGRRIALVIGNQNYDGSGLYSLSNPENDANGIAYKLKNIGFELSGGKALINADRKQMMKAVEQFQYDSENAEISLFYFSGHGALEDNQNLLLPVGENYKKGLFREHCISQSSITSVS